MSEKSVFSIFHPDASDLFNVCSDLRKVCEDLSDPHTRLPVSVWIYESESNFNENVLFNALISFYL
jgi:hypothetical protein